VTPMGPGRMLELHVDGVAALVPEGATLLDACDAVERYVPRLCYVPSVNSPGLGRPQEQLAKGKECGLCSVVLDGAGVVLACKTPAVEGARISTVDESLRGLRLERLESVLSIHPHICLSCPDKDGCSRGECTYGNPPEARCCGEWGRCELGRLAEWLDADAQVSRRPVVVDRAATIEGRIRWEPGLCIGCGRCVRVCTAAPAAGAALELDADGTRARPRNGTLRKSGCTFCALCVLVCPSGAISAPGERGSRWLAARQQGRLLSSLRLPPTSQRALALEELSTVSREAGVFTLLDGQRRALLIRGVADLRAGLETALGDPSCRNASFFRCEPCALYTQRETELLARYVSENGRLPAANDLGDELFDK
jgi:predicted molibdopterin-dependent oxidoreductase YjgC